METDVPLQLVKQEQQLLEQIEELEQRVERSEGPSDRDVAEWMGRARGRLHRPPRRPRRARPAWLWPLVGGAALLVVIGIAIVVAPRLIAALLLPTVTPQAADTRVSPTATSQPTEAPLVLTATLLPSETTAPEKHQPYTATPLAPTATLPAVETATPEPYTGARPPAEASIGDTWTRPTDGMVMAYVPAGEFLMGSSDADGQAQDNEKPQHTVYLDGYWIDRTEVTNSQYRKCVEAQACPEPRCWVYGDYNGPGQPVVCVTWDDAQAYAAWVGGRLPTEAEWEKAARGTDGRIYPWGNSAPDCDKANYANCMNPPAAVGSFPLGVSPYGALDMAGNVWEWVEDWYEDWYYDRSPARNPRGPDAGEGRVYRGGALGLDDRYVRCAFRLGTNPDHRDPGRGFRVVVSPAGL